MSLTNRKLALLPLYQSFHAVRLDPAAGSHPHGLSSYTLT
jgi:hypothetical protein